MHCGNAERLVGAESKAMGGKRRAKGKEEVSVPRPEVKLAKRQKRGGYQDPDCPCKVVPETF